jgi:ATP-dependent DNA helicase RecG
MNEKELQQYLLLNYPKEDERCEWKEFKNLKNDFNGKEKDDVISYISALANMEGGHLVIGVVDKTLEIVGTNTYNYDVEKACLRLKDQCANLPTEGLNVEEFVTEDTNKTVWVIHVPKHTAKLPVYAHSKAFQRLNDSLIELTIERRNAILEEVSMTADWSAHIVEDATIDDLEPQALMMARFQFKKVYPDLSTEVDTWDDMKLLSHAGVASHGKLTRAALVLLGKSSSSILLNPAVVQVTWILKDAEGRKIAYEHFGMPMLLNVDRILSKIRNLTLRELPGGTLFPDIEKQYDDYSIRELLHNCLAHEDYTLQERIVLTEEPGFLTFSNGGFFLPGTIQNVLENGGPQKYYRNYCLCQGMVSFNMIDTIGHGIEKVFSEQKRRKCFLPEYTIDNVAKEVSVKVYARDNSDATDSFMMSEKNIERHDNVRKEPFMVSGKGVKHHDNIMITSGKHQESIRIRLTKNQDFILLALHRDPNLTIPELAEIVGIAGRNIAENLKKLQELGLLERVGSRKGGKWIVRN